MKQKGPSWTQIRDTALHDLHLRVAQCLKGLHEECVKLFAHVADHLKHAAIYLIGE